jgi:hypothetical protein
LRIDLLIPIFLSGEGSSCVLCVEVQNDRQNEDHRGEMPVGMQREPI